MELLFSVRRKPLKIEPPQLENISDPEIIQPIITISCGNIIAFTSHTALTGSDINSWAGNVYVCDLNTPWDTHCVTTTQYPISALEWDAEGKDLVIGTVTGDVMVMSMKNCLLNQWHKTSEGVFTGEHILRAIFFHNGRRITMNDKKPDAPVTERFQLQKLQPTFKGFGGMANEGVLVVTGTGLVSLVHKECTVSDSLRPFRDRVTNASLAHKNGNVYVSVVSHGNVYNAMCTVLYRKVVITQLPSLLIGTAATVTWCIRDDLEYLLVTGQTFSVWKLADKAHPVHKFLSKGGQGNTTPGAGHKPECYNTIAWCQVSTSSSPSSWCSASSCESPVLAALCHRSTLRLLHRDTLLPMSSITVTSPSFDSGVASPPKRLKYGRKVSEEGVSLVSMSVSALGGVLAAIDTHCTLYVYKLPQLWNDAPTPLSIQHATNILEYSIVTGYDYTDVLMTIKPTALDAIIDRVTESFQRHPQQFQQFYYHNWLTLRTALYRVSSRGQWSSSSLCVLSWVHCACAALDGAVRSGEGADTLQHVLDDQDRDVDKALLAIDVKEFAVDTGTLQALRRLIQKTCDTALALIAAVPTLSQRTHNGYELCTDPVAINLLRKMILVIRIWGLIRPQALPSFSRGADNLDAIYRPLTRLAALKGSGVIPPDVVEECATLMNQVSALRVWESLPRCCICTPNTKHYPLHFEYGVVPDSMKYTPEPPANYLPVDSAPAPMDSIRYMYLGEGAVSARVCGRCGVRTHPHYAGRPSHDTHPVQAAYDARYLPTCRCGGKWTLVSNV